MKNKTKQLGGTGAEQYRYPWVTETDFKFGVKHMVSIDSSSTTGLSVSCRILLPPCKFQSQRQCSCRAVGEGRAFVTGFSETFSWHFWGEESGPLLRQSGQHRFPSCSYDAIQNKKQHKKKKKQYFADSCHHWKTNWAVGIKVRGGPRLYTQQLRGIEGLGWKVSWWLVRGLSRVIGLALPAW